MPATATPATSPRRPADRFASDRGPRGNGPPPRGGSFRRGGQPHGGPKPPPTEHEILFQKFFKSVGPRTYAAQVKRAKNGNNFLVLTEGKREADSGEVRKTRLFVYSEDFVEFFRLVKAAAVFIKANPLPDDVRQKRERYWVKQRSGASSNSPRAVAAGGNPRRA